MIVYFSATGNSKYIAQKIAFETNDIALSILETKDKIILKKGEQLGIVAPTYFWRLPSIVEDFLKRIKISNAQNSYVFFIATYGSTCGQADYYAKKLLKRNAINLSASFGIKTVDNWTVEFDVGNKDQVQALLQDEQRQLTEIIAQIKQKREVFIVKDKKSLFLCNGAKYFYDKARKTAHLNVSDNCTGCGVCAKNCPLRAIQIVDGKPLWILKSCTMCFGCLHNCPQFAINYANKTQNNGQYLHPKFEK